MSCGDSKAETVGIKKRNYSGGIQRIEMTSVPDVNRKYEYIQAIKELCAKGLQMANSNRDGRK